MKTISLIVVLLLLTPSLYINTSAEEALPLPSVGDRFVYQVKVTGNREATKEGRALGGTERSGRS